MSIVLVTPVDSPKPASANVLPPLTLVLGGARSGKSLYAESLLSGHPAPYYLATAEARDDEMDARIRLHRARRGGPWITVEEPLDLAGALAKHATPGRALLVDCLTLWLSNLMEQGVDIEASGDHLLETLKRLSAPVVVIANEVGLGIVPTDHKMARDFRDHAGRLNQRMASICQRVVFVAAGLPLILKDAR
jgi:adenosylcobinamide kinase/adenosylcobinamide-phosphate guanylyltransferase